MQAPWHQEVSEDVRKQLITEMYHELVRISGNNDPQNVWRSAAKFELMLWSNSDDRTTYMAKMQRKIVSLRRKPTFQPPPTTTTTGMGVKQPLQGQQTVTTTQPGYTVLMPGIPAPVNELTLQQQQAQQVLRRLQAQCQAQNQQLLRVQQQETQQLRQQQLTQQQQLSLLNQQQRLPVEQRRQQLQQLQQQHQLARVQLEHIHQSKQQRLQHEQTQYLLQQRQQLQIRTTVKQPVTVPTVALAQPQQPQSVHVQPQQQAAVALQQPQESGITVPKNTRGVKPEKLQAAHDQQARMRGMQRAKNVVDLEQTTLAHAAPGVVTTEKQERQVENVKTQPHAQTPAHTQPQVSTSMTESGQQASVDQVNAALATHPASLERLRELKAKHWDDVVTVYKELDRMVKQRRDNPKQERATAFLTTLRQVIALLQDPSKITGCSNESLDRVEAHIRTQVLPIRHRLQEKARTSSASGSTAPLNAQQVQQDAVKEQQAKHEALMIQHKAQRAALLQAQEQQKTLLEMQRAELQRQRQDEEEKKLQMQASSAAEKKTQDAVDPSRQGKQLFEVNQAQQLQVQVRSQHEGQVVANVAPHNDLAAHQQATLGVNQQQEAPVSANAVLNETNEVACAPAKSAKPLPGTTASAVAMPVNGTAAADAASSNKAASMCDLTPPPVELAGTPASPSDKSDKQVTSVVPDLTGLSPSEKLLTAVSAFEKNNSDVLRRSSVRFSRVALAVGAKLCTAYNASDK